MGSKMWCSLPLGPLEAEAKAADEASSFAWDVGVREVIFESDSKEVSDDICGTITPWVTIVDIIEGTLHRMQAFRRTQFQHVRRTTNQTAHTLARHAKGISEFVAWLEESPPFLDSLVSREAMQLILFFSIKFQYFSSKKKKKKSVLFYMKKKSKNIYYLSVKQVGDRPMEVHKLEPDIDCVPMQ
ncbi:hypothetical protein SO802_013051 [Lithocarpus litseifolius]|uniref:RNase H type-1 domain-containing protein n=1 Tax=Lithocarpus litseifolius TaxID=425828 RepID=A0AAW2D4K1_9ROSI